MIPLKYNLRNLRVRWVTTLLTVLGTALVVFSSCLLFGMAAGLRHSLTISGEPLDLIVLRKGSSNETNGGFDLAKAEELTTLGGIATDENGLRLVALELLNIPVVQRRDGSRVNLIVRGVDPASRPLRPNFQIVQGRDFETGREECIVAQNIARRIEGAALGELLRVGEKEAYRVVGIFTAGGSAAESEVWVDRKDLERNTAREGSVSSVQIRAADPASRDRLRQTINDDTRFRLQAWTEAEYFESQQRSSQLLQIFGIVISAFLTFGAMFSAANTMFAAVKNRTREVGTMRALGFSRFHILVSFLGESLLLCLVGGLIGILAILPLSLSSLSFDLNSLDTFAAVTGRFRIDATVGVVALVMTITMGLVGGLFPALRAVRLNVINALREA
jgi:putative ABC transport system permease protein